MKTIFVGKCRTIDWQELVNSLEGKDGDVRTYGIDFYINADGRFNEIIEQWKKAGYDKSGTVEWINYYPDKHFDATIIKQFEEFTKTTCIRAWVSKIRPGKYAPYHIDIDDKEEEYLAQGELVRYTAHPCVPSKGQVLIVDQTVFHLEEQGNIYRWPDYRAWHAGGNCSFEPKYLFNFLGIKK
jgi:hypothetical protein